MSRPLGDEWDAYITVAAKRIPVALDPAGRGHIRSTPRSSAISRILLGDSVQQSDAEQPQLLLSDQREGMGLQAYNEQEGLGKFRVSGWDTRFQGLLAFPPNPTQLGGSLPNTGTLTGFVWRVEQLNGQPATLPLFNATPQGFPSRYNGAGTWVQIGGATFTNYVTGYARFRQYYIIAAGIDGSGVLAYSTDGTTWTGSASGVLARCCAVHDNKLWALSYIGGGRFKLQGLTDPAAAGSVLSDQELLLHPGEQATQLVAWQFGGFPALYVLTNQRLMRYDDRTLTFHEYDTFEARVPVGGTVIPQGAVGADGNLYVTFYNSGGADRGDDVWQYSGNSNGPVGPNRQGGIPAANTFTFTHLTPMLHWTLGWTTQRAGTTNLPRLLAMSPQLGWGTVYESTNGAAFLIGGGYDGNGTAYLVLSNAQVWTLPLPDVADLPQNASGATPPRTYRNGINVVHRYGISDLGLPNVPKLILGLEVHARTTAGVRNALDPNVTLQPRYALDGGAPADAGGVLSSASVWPARIPLNGGLGVRCYDVEVRLEAATGNTANSPLIEAVILYYLPLFQVREEWEVSVVTDPLHPAARGRYGENEPYQYYGESPESLRKHLRDNAGASAVNNYRAQVVAVSFGGGALENDATLMSVAAAEYRIQADEDPAIGKGIMVLSITNRTLAASG
jgi:hypothetical protein